MGANRLIFALDPKLEMDTETLVLPSGQKFMCFVVQFHENFRFWYQTGNVPEKVYAVIWPLLEISSLKKENVYVKTSCLTKLYVKKSFDFVQVA